MDNSNKVLSQTSVLKLYHAVIDDVIANVRDDFLDEGVDEQILQEMKQIWTNKLHASKAVEATPDPQQSQPPPILSNTSKVNGTKSKKSVSAAANNNDVNKTNPSMNGSTSKTMSNVQTIQQVSQALPSTMNTTKVSQQPTASTFQQQQTKSEPVTNQQSSITNQTINQQSTTQQQQQPSQMQQAQTTQKFTLDPNKLIPIQITLPPQPGTTNTAQRVLTIQVPASAIQENQLQKVLTGNIITSIMPLAPDVASTVLQQHVNSMLSASATTNNIGAIIGVSKQMDGINNDTSDEDASEDGSDMDAEDDDDDIENDDEENDDSRAEEEPLNSEDDVTDEDAADLFDTDNVVVCQYDKITRSRNKWKFYLKDGIMHLSGKDYVFQKSNGDAEW
jgi:transcription initiation factor TFIIA large subunit